VNDRVLIVISLETPSFMNNSQFVMHLLKGPHTRAVYCLEGLQEMSKILAYLIRCLRMVTVFVNSFRQTDCSICPFSVDLC
jgi:hypothetical protein